MPIDGPMDSSMIKHRDTHTHTDERNVHDNYASWQENIWPGSTLENIQLTQRCKKMITVQPKLTVFTM